MLESLSQEKQIKILIADDHNLVRESVLNILKEVSAFHVVGEAQDGLEAVEKARTVTPDIVLMDINMPKLNGIEATRLIKQEMPSVKVIGFSIQDDDDDSVAFLMKKVGAVKLLNKSGDPRILIETILSCMGR